MTNLQDVMEEDMYSQQSPYANSSSILNPMGTKSYNSYGSYSNFHTTDYYNTGNGVNNVNSTNFTFTSFDDDFCTSPCSIKATSLNL